MEELKYYDLERMIQKCVSGDIDMHEPIEVTNILKNQRHEMSILKHFLLLCQSDKKSLIHILSILRYQIKQKLLELINSNHFINRYIQNIIHEWSLDITPVDLFTDGLDQCNYIEGEDLVNYDNLLEERKKIQEGGMKLQTLEDALKERQLSYTPMTRDYADQIKQRIKDLHTECTGCIGRIKGHTSNTMERYSMLDPKHTDILLDLSTKSKSTYLEYSNRIQKDESSSLSIFMNEVNDLDIPDNIHTIFLNYILTLTMIKKEMNFISHSFKGLLSTIQPKMGILDKFMDGSNELELLVVDEAPEKSNEPSSSSGSIFGLSFF